jgi:hypothetical protein
VLGSDGAGTVAAVGDRVKGLKPGDPVYAFGLLNPKGGFYAEYAAPLEDPLRITLELPFGSGTGSSSNNEITSEEKSSSSRGRAVWVKQLPGFSPRKGNPCAGGRRIKFYNELAIPADSFARAVAFAMSQPEDVGVNEIPFCPTRPLGEAKQLRLTFWVRVETSSTVTSAVEMALPPL